MRKKMLIMATTAAMIEQFNKENILLLEKMGYEVHVAGNFLMGNPISEQSLECFKEWLEGHHGKWFHIPSVRKPVTMDNYKAYKQIVEMINKYHYEFIHCHTPIGSVIGRLAASRTRTKVMYTAHGFHFYKGASLKNWLFYYPIEKICSYMTDILITINKEDYALAQKRMKAKKNVYIPGIGIKIETFHGNREKVRRELGISKDSTLLLSVGELNENKNHESVIRALAGIEEVKKGKIFYAIAGQGKLKESLLKLIDELGMKKQIFLLGYREDMPDLYSAADVYIFPSYREGLSVALMEAMASKLPVVCSRIRGNVDLIDDKGGVLFRANDIADIRKKIVVMLAKDKEAVVKMGIYNLQKVRNFDRKVVEKTMLDVYEEILKI